MTMMKSLLAAATTVAMTGAAMAYGHSKTVVDIAAGDDRFTTLVAAVGAAGLAETLSGEGPFTVFAPSTQHSQPYQKAQSRHCCSQRTKAI